MNPIMLGLLRHVLTLGAGVLVTRGVVDASAADQVVGGVIGLIGVLWSVSSKKEPQQFVAGQFVTGQLEQFVPPSAPPLLTVLPPEPAPVSAGYILSDVSRQKLAGVNPVLRQIVETAITLTSVDFRVTEGLRTAERQAELVSANKSWIKRSKHQDGLAVDVAALPDGNVSWDWTHYEKINEAMQEAARRHNARLTWGGHWKQRDGVHWQYEGELS